MKYVNSIFLTWGRTEGAIPVSLLIYDKCIKIEGKSFSGERIERTIPKSDIRELEFKATISSFRIYYKDGTTEVLPLSGTSFGRLFFKRFEDTLQSDLYELFRNSNYPVKDRSLMTQKEKTYEKLYLRCYDIVGFAIIAFFGYIFFRDLRHVAIGIVMGITIMIILLLYRVMARK